MTSLKQYLGDSVYADLDDARGILLTTENGFGPSNTIYLEPEVYEALLRWVGWVKSKLEAKSHDE